MALLYPPTCVLCGAAGDAGRDLCAGCAADMPRIGHCCTVCALPLAGRDGRCGGCQHRPPPYDRCTAVFRYETPLPALVGGMKFRARLNLVRLLGDLVADALLLERESPRWATPDAIVPVPLHPRRLRQRGYNQALEMARVVGRRLAIRVDARTCWRTRATLAQSELDERRRLTNIRGAFAATAPLPTHVAILDDVVTTGATVSELARVLRRSGCERIEVWALARTP